MQLRGTLSTYASFLDLEPDSVLLRYADAIQARRIELVQAETSKASKPNRKPTLPLWVRGFLSPDLVFGGSMILILLALSIWGAERIFSTSSLAAANPTQGPSISDVLLATQAGMPTVLDAIPTSILEDTTALPTPDAAQLSASGSETPIATSSSAVQVTVEVLQRTFLRVTVDGEVKQDGRVSPGAALTFDGTSRIEVLTGSGNAVQIVFNQSSLGVMGNLGEVVYRIYTVNGVETPTPTPSPTPTITPTRTVKPTPSKIPTPTRKPTLTVIPPR